MISAIETFVIKIFGGNSYFATFFISMIPFIELKGAVPFGMSRAIFGKNALPPALAWIASSTGAAVPAFFVLWLFPKLFARMKTSKAFGRAFLRLESSFKEKAGSLCQPTKQKRGLKDYIMLSLFVALPLPLTGAYTGSLVACVSGFSYFSAMVCILIGNFVCGGIVVLLCTIFKGYEAYILLGFALLLAIVVAFRLARFLAKKFKKAS